MNFIRRMDRVKGNDFNWLEAESPSSPKKERASTARALKLK
jgi:hypothetical protein